MKINILTQPLFCNYGGILQNYALQEVLCRMGHEPLTVNLPAPKPGRSVKWKDAIKSCINFYRRLKGEYQCPFLNPHTFSVKEHELSFPQREFVKKNIIAVTELPPFKSDVCDRHPADAWIVGSDQVWRPWCSHYIENCFFDFIPDDGTRRVAYAASLGTDKWEMSDSLTKKLQPLAKKFDAISVREESGVRLCKDYLDVEAVHVLDPTMLLNADDYLSLTTDNDYPKGKYVATYVLDINAEKAKAIKTFARDKDLKVQKVGQMHKDRFDSVESWLASIAHAEYVITDSFHGTVFSILFGRPVKVMANSTRGNTRIQSLFTTLSLTPDSNGFVHPDESTIEILKSLRNDSLSFLESSLING